MRMLPAAHAQERDLKMTRWKWAFVPLLLAGAMHARPAQAWDSTGTGASARPAGAVEGTYYAEYPAKLLLSPGGRFSWHLIVDGGDHYMKGSWRADQASVTLTSDPRDASERLFEIATVGPWSADAEDKLSQAIRADMQNQVSRNCPFLGTLKSGLLSIVTSAALAQDDRQGKPPASTSAQEEKALAKLHGEARAARDGLVAAIADALGDATAMPVGDDRSRRLAAVDGKVQTYLAAQQAMTRAYGDQHRDAPDDTLVDGRYEACLAGIESPDAGKNGGYVVHIRDGISWFGVPPVVVEFHFADGSGQQRLTEGDWAAVSRRPGVGLRRIVLDPMSKTAAAVELKVDLDEAGVIEVRMDSTLADAVPFPSIVFQRDGRDLLASGRGWRYQYLGDVPRDGD